MPEVEVNLPWWRKAVAPLILLLIVILFFWKLILTNQYSWLEAPDIAWQVLPWFQYQATQFHQHVFPLWDPHEFGGQSLIGQDQPGLLYPLNWILFLMPLRDGHVNVHYLNWYYMLIHYSGALFCYWLCRDLGRGEIASVIGGISFGLGGFLGTVPWPQMINSAVWGPLVLLFLFRALRGQNPKTSAALSGVFLGMSWLGGHHLVPIYLSMAAIGVWLYSLFEGGKFVRGRIVPAAVFLVFSALTGAAQMWPTFAYGRSAVRWVGAQNDPITWNQIVPYTVHKLYGLDPRYLLGVILPRFDGHLTAYTGVVVLALACLAVARFWSVREVRLLLALGVVGMFLAPANNDVFHGILYSVFPMFQKAREPVYLLYFFHLSVAVLAAFGLDAVMATATRAGLRRIAIFLTALATILFLIVFGVFIVRQQWTGDDRVMVTILSTFALAGLLYRMSRAEGVRCGIPLLIVALCLVELGNSTLYYLPHKDETSRNIYLKPMEETKEIAEFLRRQPGPVRVWTNRDDVPFNFGDWYGLDELFGYAPSVPANYFQIEAHTLPGRRIFSTAYTVSRKPVFADQKEIFRSASGIAVYQNPDVMPRVWTVHNAIKVRDLLDARIHFHDPNFDLKTRTFSYAPSPVLESCDGDEIRSSRWEINRTSLAVNMKCRGMVIVSENNAPGWRALIDGKPAPLYDAYTTLRGIVVDSGNHTIEMQYRPLSFIAGAIATLLGLAAALALWLRLPA